MTMPSRTEWIILWGLMAIATAMNVKEYGWIGIFRNTNPLGFMVSAWIWCLVLHRK
jgi:hypothetical protein